MAKKDLKKFQDQTKLSTQNYLTAEAVAGELLSLYEVDFAAWVDTQALLLEQGRYEELDKANLIEEIRDLSKRERSALNNNLRIVLLHLLKWQFQSDRRSRSWKSSIVEHRQRIEQSLEESPSLKTYLENVFKDVYFRAVKKAEIETGLNRNTFPVDCPYTLAEILDVDFMPVETMIKNAFEVRSEHFEEHPNGCQYHFKRSFSEDPTLSAQLFNLLETAFPGIGISRAAETGRMLGAAWEDASTPFIRFHNDIAVTHVGVVEIPMQIMGQTVTVGGIHGVCTHPEFRRRGYYREVMTEVLNYCASQYETLILTTAQPEFYQPFGFRVVKEHIFSTKSDSTGWSNGFRLLNTSDPNDLKLLHRLLETREPVSNIVGVLHEKAVFFVNEGTRPLHYAEDLDLIVSMEIENTQLKLFDVVGTRICNLTAILERIPQRIEEVITYFSCDRLGGDFQAFSDIFEGDSLLMVRGLFAAEDQQFMLPRSARC